MLKLADALRDPAGVRLFEIQNQIAEAEIQNGGVGHRLRRRIRRLFWPTHLGQFECHAFAYESVGRFSHLEDEVGLVQLEALEKTPVFDLNMPQEKDLSIEGRVSITPVWHDNRNKRVNADLNDIGVVPVT